MSKKQDIFDTTLRLITERGLHDTPMAMVASEAQVAAGTIYHHFKNKEDLILELYKHIKGKIHDAITIDSNQDATYQRQFVQFWRSIYNYYLSNPAQFKFIEQFENSPYYLKITQDDVILFEEKFDRFLLIGIEERHIKPLPTRLMTQLLLGSIAAVTKARLKDESEIDNSKVIKAIQVCWDGFRTKGLTAD
jgi:AcrR family transcriptional regulator